MRVPLRLILVGGCLCLLALILSFAGVQADEQGTGTSPKPLVTISAATTSITQPLRDDGYPDYIAALNQAISAGVTNENNAAIPMMQAFGPSMLLEAMQEPFFTMLGIDPLPAEGNYLTSFDTFRDASLAKPADVETDAAADADERARLDEAYNQSLERPWSAEEFPLLAEWLRANDEPLRLITEATERPRYYAPLVAADGTDDSAMVMSILLPVLQELREASRLLKARALLRLHEGELEAAWQDLFTCHRLGRLAAQDPTLIGALVGIAIDSVAITGDTFLAADPRLSDELARRILTDLRTLGPAASIVEKLDTAERYMFLDSVCAVAGGRVGLSDLTGDGSDSSMGWIARLAASVLVDWNVSLRMGNTWYDRLVTAAKLPTHTERQAAFDEINRDTQKMAAEVRDAKNALYGLFAPRTVISRQMGNVFVALLLPAVSAAMDAENRSTTLTKLNELSFVLAAYRAEQGGYPESLADLAIDDDSMPKDPFNDEDFHYVRHDDGYVIYSVGPNLRDDGGKVYYLDKDDDGRTVNKDQWDDFRIRVPPTQ